MYATTDAFPRSGTIATILTGGMLPLRVQRSSSGQVQFSVSNLPTATLSTVVSGPILAGDEVVMYAVDRVLSYLPTGR
jgi:hypothetical protein